MFRNLRWTNTTGTGEPTGSPNISGQGSLPLGCQAWDCALQPRDSRQRRQHLQEGRSHSKPSARKRALPGKDAPSHSEILGQAPGRKRDGGVASILVLEAYLSYMLKNFLVCPDIPDKEPNHNTQHNSGSLFHSSVLTGPTVSLPTHGQRVGRGHG